ncbi:MAG: ABC transporter ATP-binding protein [Acutalibacteraceae bacterium]|nr:ABC transporter ATP-binding protein [Acutalibacteraceae bacterium]
MKKNNKGMMKKWFIPYFVKHRKILILDLICAGLTTGCELVLPMIVREITSIATTDLSRLTLKLVLSMAGLYAVLKLIDMAAGYYMTYIGHGMGVKIEKDMREDLFSHLLTVPFSYFDKTKIGQLMSRITTDLFDISEFSHHCPEEFFIAGLKVTVSFAVLTSINPLLTVSTFIAVPLIFFGSLYFRRKMRSAFKERREISGDVNAQTETTLLGIRVVKSFGNENIEREKFNSESTRLSKVQTVSYKYMARLNCVVRLFDGLMYLVMILLGGYFLITGKITAADMTAYLLYIGMLIAAIKRIVEFTEQFEKGVTGVERFREIMEIPPESGYEGREALTQVEGRIDFENVTFSYEEEKGNVLTQINLSVEKGENIAVVGPSGSGKTTLCSLISRFYELKEGRILLDGKDINDLSLESLRNAVGVVQQDVYLFSGTVLENILYGCPSKGKEDAIEAAKKAGAHDFIMSLPQNYDTYVGERGVMLSGGQKQRISIARVFVKNPPVLVLDEATSALDNESEQYIKKSLAELTTGRTTFTIAHRLSTVKNASRIIVLTSKGIEEQGTHAELMLKDGFYKKLYESEI